MDAYTSALQIIRASLSSNVSLLPLGFSFRSKILMQRISNSVEETEMKYKNDNIYIETWGTCSKSYFHHWCHQLISAQWTIPGDKEAKTRPISSAQLILCP